MAVPEERHGRGHRFKGKSRQEDTPVFTLEEWERRKTVGSASTAERHVQDTSRDEELARQLQEQLDLEDSHVSFHFHLISLSLKRASSNNSLTTLFCHGNATLFREFRLLQKLNAYG
jgi:hypothetical protein